MTATQRRIACWLFIVGVLVLLLAIVRTVGTAAELPVNPDRTLTPGAVYPDNEATVCGKVNGSTYEKRSRASLTTDLKRQITRAYGETPGQDGDHELDHDVPAALAGRSDAANVWWQPGTGHGTVWTYELKDRLDDWAWRQVCRLHTMTLAQGQALFLVPDWRPVYCAHRQPGWPVGGCLP